MAGPGSVGGDHHPPNWSKSAQIRVFGGLKPPIWLNVKDFPLIVSLLLFKKLIVVCCYRSTVTTISLVNVSQR